jgi:DNA-binding CsgD family transcriptional regulator
MQYYLLLVQAKDKSFKDIRDDSVICDVKNYFLKKKDFSNATVAAFYCGRVFAERKDDQQALQAYLDAETIAANTADNVMKGKIQHNAGYIYYNTGADYDKAIDHLKKATGFFQAANSDAYTISSLKFIGTCFLIKKHADSTLFYQMRALDMATANHDTTTYADLLNSLSGVYRQMGDNSKAKTYALQAVALKEHTPLLLNLAYIYRGINNNDSAAFYATRVLQLCERDSIAPPVSVYDLLMEIERTNRNYQKALAYSEEYTKQIINFLGEKRTQMRTIAGIQEKYELEVLKNEQQKANNKSLVVLLVVAVVIILLSVGLFYSLNRVRKNKIRFLKSEQENNMNKIKLLELEQENNMNKIKLLETEQENNMNKVKLLEIEQESQDNRNRHINLLATLTQMHSSEKTFTKQQIKTFFEVFNKQFGNTSTDTYKWEDLYKDICRLSNNFPDRIKTAFPGLSDTEFSICVLLYTQRSYKDIAAILVKSPDGIKSRMTDIRKKLHLKEKANIAEFLQQKLTKNPLADDFTSKNPVTKNIS